MGGMALHDGRLAEMATGEGKTLVAVLPVYLNALSGKIEYLYFLIFSLNLFIFSTFTFYFRILFVLVSRFAFFSCLKLKLIFLYCI